MSAIVCRRCEAAITYTFDPATGTGEWRDERATTFGGFCTDGMPHATHEPIPLHVRWQMWQWARKHHPGGIVTKWHLIDAEHRESLAVTPCNLDCSGCGEHLHTEADFAQHFTVPDPTYLNLGECPNDRDPMRRRG
jgi:hypothetical protein